jgi:hypothetical protein
VGKTEKRNRALSECGFAAEKAQFTRQLLPRGGMVMDWEQIRTFAIGCVQPRGWLPALLQFSENPMYSHAIGLSEATCKIDGKSVFLDEFTRKPLEFCGAIRAFFEDFANFSHESILPNVRRRAFALRIAFLGRCIPDWIVVSDVFSRKNTNFDVFVAKTRLLEVGNVPIPDICLSGEEIGASVKVDHASVVFRFGHFSPFHQRF